MKLATILDEYQPLQLKEDNITDLMSALDGGYLPQWPEQRGPHPNTWRWQKPLPPLAPVNGWKVAGEAALAVLGLTLVLLALLSTMGVI